jgi:hypothetical protein
MAHFPVTSWRAPEVVLLFDFGASRSPPAPEYLIMQANNQNQQRELYFLSVASALFCAASTAADVSLFLPVVFACFTFVALRAARSV